MSAPTTDPERALVGAALMGAAHVLDLVHAEDIADARLQVIAGVVQELREAGVPVDPTTALAHARATGTVTRTAAVRAFAELLHDVVAECPLPAAARYYAVAVLDEAIRRRCAELSSRIGQAADAESLPSLLALVSAEHQAVQEIAARRTAVSDDSPRLRAVGA